MSNLWTPDEDKILIDCIVHQDMSYRETSEQLKGRTKDAIRHRWDKVKDRVDLEETSAVRVTDIPKVTFRSAVFDIETMDFKAGGQNDFMVCTCILPLDSDEVITTKIKREEVANDKNLIIRTLDELSKFDILIGHNIAAFDLNWLKSRAMVYNIDMPKPWLRYDTYQVAKTMAIKTVSKSLANLCTFFGIETSKTSIYKPEWTKISSPYKAEFEHALDHIVEHCVYDVQDNRELFYALWKYDTKKRLKRTKW
jgi:DNA polymerase elongation subunit (family B)